MRQSNVLSTHRPLYVSFASGKHYARCDCGHATLVYDSRDKARYAFRLHNEQR
jgi:hypothetical protein